MTRQVCLTTRGFKPSEPELSDQQRGGERLGSGRDASVRDVILACANAKGGVHLGDSRTHEQSTIMDFDEVVRVIGLEPSLAALRGLCAIVVRALSPLAHAIQRPKGGSPANQQFDRR